MMASYPLLMVVNAFLAASFYHNASQLTGLNLLTLGISVPVMQFVYKNIFYLFSLYSTASLLVSFNYFIDDVGTITLINEYITRP